MNYLIGTDEAGYGPLLGPLVVAATVWELPAEDGEPVDVDLYDRLRHCVCRRASRAAKAPPRRLPIADSKALYSPAQGIGLLEQGVHVALGLLDQSPATWHEAWDALCPQGPDDAEVAPWHADYEARLPLAASTSEIERLVRRMRSGLERAGIRLLAVGGRAIFPAQFNQLIDQYGNKSDALSAVSLELLSEMMVPLSGGRVSVVCDKHGGRDYYAPLVQHYFPEWLIEVRREGERESRYSFGPDTARTTICFRCQGERALPVALASMTAKYLRELAMRAFNDYWCRHLPDLRPTAGYARDAQRFRREVAELQTSLGIDDRMMWRGK